MDGLNDLHPPDDYSHRFFIWHEWIQANGPLTTENVFEYFTTSMFYDKQSNNQVLRMQTMHTGMPVVNEAEELKRFTGVEFALVHSVPPSLFIIHKRERISPDEVRPLSAYFIMNNRIYQSPDLYTVLSNRLLTSLHSLQCSLDILRTHRPDYIPRTGFVWPIVDTSISEDVNKKRASEEEHADSGEASDTGAKVKVNNPPPGQKRQQNNLLLFNAMRATAAHSKMSFTSSAFIDSVDPTPAEVPPTASGTRSSTTPAPTPVTSNPPPVASTPREAPPRAPAGAGKKKRKPSKALLQQA